MPYETSSPAENEFLLLASMELEIILQHREGASKL